ncbi:MAG: UDP-N-acetylmuramoyl-L-alanine--D-glutamate ligase, partial [Patescibacteria group bacterium]
KNIHFVLGKHRLEDFRKCDMVIKSAGVPLDSPYILEAVKHKIPVEMDASLFVKFTPATIVGVTGTRGKSTVTHLIEHILDIAYPGHIFVGGNVRGVATLPLLKKAKVGDIVVLELDSWQLQGFGDAEISPHVSVFTNFLHDHMNYYKGDMEKYWDDKANIFKFQTEDNTLVLGEQALKEFKKRNCTSLSDIQVTKKSVVPAMWKIKIPGEHNRANIASAVLVCRELDVSEEMIKRGVESFVGVPGRLEYLRTVHGVKYYNDTTSTTPDGNRVALLTLADKSKKNIILIAGGNDKELDYSDMAKLIHKTVKGLVLIEGTATDKLLAKIPKKTQYPVYVVDTMKDAVMEALGHARRGDTILLSPGAASFGIFKNEFDRGDQFVKIIRTLK